MDTKTVISELAPVTEMIVNGKAPKAAVASAQTEMQALQQFFQQHPQDAKIFKKQPQFAQMLNLPEFWTKANAKQVRASTESRKFCDNGKAPCAMSHGGLPISGNAFVSHAMIRHTNAGLYGSLSPEERVEVKDELTRRKLGATTKIKDFQNAKENVFADWNPHSRKNLEMVYGKALVSSLWPVAQGKAEDPNEVLQWKDSLDVRTGEEDPISGDKFVPYGEDLAAACWIAKSGRSLAVCGVCPFSQPIVRGVLRNCGACYCLASLKPMAQRLYTPAGIRDNPSCPERDKDMSPTSPTLYLGVCLGRARSLLRS